MTRGQRAHSVFVAHVLARGPEWDWNPTPWDLLDKPYRDAWEAAAEEAAKPDPKPDPRQEPLFR